MKKKINCIQLLDGSKYNQNENRNKKIKSVCFYIGKRILSLGIIFFALVISSFDELPTYKITSNSETFVVKKGKMNKIKRGNSLEGVSYEIRESFVQRFPKIKNVKWSNIDGYTAIDFTKGSSMRVALYNINGNLIGTGSNISYNALPKESFKEINKYYKNYVPEETIHYSENGLNGNGLNMYGTTTTGNGYYALMKDKKNNKEILLQISPNGEVSYYGNFF
ncbi:MAG TPA: hypothetical protein VMU83_20350 [Hanamia sp.]|nr:hypothetical protein [Hanamia sp.]